LLNAHGVSLKNACAEGDYAARSGLPHSKQHALYREVIKPQNGHILCAPEFPGAVLPNVFLAASAIHANSART
jgi:hypothetical protein